MTFFNSPAFFIGVTIEDFLIDGGGGMEDGGLIDDELVEDGLVGEGLVGDGVEEGVVGSTGVDASE